MKTKLPPISMEISRAFTEDWAQRGVPHCYAVHGKVTLDGIEREFTVMFFPEMKPMVSMSTGASFACPKTKCPKTFTDEALFRATRKALRELLAFETAAFGGPFNPAKAAIKIK